MHTYHTTFVRSPVDGHMGCFHFSAVVNSDERGMGLHTSSQHTDLISFGCAPRTRIARSSGGSIFNVFWRSLHTVVHMAALICIPTSSAKGFPLLYIQQLLSSVFFTMAVLHWSEEISRCGFDLPFTDD